MQDIAFSRPGQFFRGNLHTHSHHSDGILAPEEVCRRYAEEGYDFIALTDHFIGRYGFPITDTKPYRTNRFTTILGAEIHSGAMENGELWHILAVGLPEGFDPPETADFRAEDTQETGPALAERARAAGAFVAIAHPEWSGLTLADARSITAAHAVEVYNHGSAIGADRGNGFYTLDQLLTEGRRLTLCATDDAHFNEADHFGAWVMVKSEANEPEALLNALKAGSFYSSQGPEMKNITWEAGQVHVDCSAVVSVIVQGQGPAAVPVHGEALTRASVPLARFADSPWLRVTLIDRAGKKAWSNPHWVS